jgi:hypothetical protein
MHALKLVQFSIELTPCHNQLVLHTWVYALWCRISPRFYQMRRAVQISVCQWRCVCAVVARHQKRGSALWSCCWATHATTIADCATATHACTIATHACALHYILRLCVYCTLTYGTYICNAHHLYTALHAHTIVSHTSDLLCIAYNTLHWLLIISCAVLYVLVARMHTQTTTAAAPMDELLHGVYKGAGAAATDTTTEVKPPLYYQVRYTCALIVIIQLTCCCIWVVSRH